MKFVKQDYYEILNVAPGASNEEVKRAYRMVRRSFCPDSMAIHSLYSDSETEAISAKIDEAFRILSSPESARRYARYHRSGRVGRDVPRDPDDFFDLVHAQDGASPIEALAQEVSTVPSVGYDFEGEDAEEADGESEGGTLLSLLSDDSESPAPAEVFIDDLEEVENSEPSPVGSSVTMGAPRQATRPGPRRSPARSGPSSVPRGRPGGVRPQGPRASSAELAQVARQNELWEADTVRTRASGPLEVEPLPREVLEALEMECGGVNGIFLQQVRRQAGISLRDIADRTKIGISMLRDIEADRTDHFPARVYLKGYLTQICRLLRLPVPQVPERYLTRLGL